MDLQTCCLETYFEIYKFFAFIHFSISKCYNYSVENNETCRYLHNLNNECLYLIKKQYCNEYVEPNSSWVGIFYHHNNKFSEKIYCDNDTITDIKYIGSTLPQTRFEPLFMIKDDKTCICRLYTENFILNTTDRPVQRFFLQCIYKHPDMDYSIEIIIPKSHYIYKNQILSYSYIARYLHYQTEPFVFDETYTIELIDKDLENITLSCNDSVILYEKEYTINQ
jgi:hypothetical protein